MVTPPENMFAAFFSAFLSSYEKSAIESVVAEAGAKVTAVVMNRWNEVFVDKIRNKEIVVEFEIVKAAESEEALAIVRFWVKEGLERFKVSERSLGFRWFLCFLLFTQFRYSGDNSRNTLLLFDEPASNLHARAQQQLLESFLTIAGENNSLIYSTHSHHMINPAWLEMTYIIENEAVQYDEGEFESSLKKNTEVRAVPYKQFVTTYPDKKSYFQPILDKLDYSPSKLEFVNDAVFVEGKSDFYILRYFSELLGVKPAIDFMPGTGAHDLGPLIALYLGWGKNFVVMLDADAAGKTAKQRYQDDYFLEDSLLCTLADLLPAAGTKGIESLLSDAAKDLVRVHYKLAKAATKKDITRFFQEAYAAKRKLKIDKDTTARFAALFKELRARINLAYA
jgi:predicted ATP-dependent endonuclease of OLD family